MRRVCALLLAAMLLALTGCGGKTTAPPSGEDAAERDSVVVAMNLNSEPAAGFDPAYGWGAGEHVHEPLIQSTLTVTTADLEIANDLATDIRVSEDGLTWTVSIRKDVHFTDGEPLTAEDVAFTYNTVKAESSVNDFTMLDRAEAVDETTVAFHMTKPYSIWPYTMAVVGIVPQHAYGSDYGQHPIGSGRYLLRQWDRGQQIILEANPDYYGDEITMKRVTIVFMDEAAAFAAVKAGQVDLAYTAASYAGQTVAGYQLLDYETVDNRGFNLPTVAATGTVGNDVTADSALRQAINLGLNRQEMIDNVLNGYGTPAYSVCDKMPWFNPETTVDFDFDGAIALLEQSGWVAGADGIRVKDGLRAELSLLYPTGDSVRQALAADTSNQLKKLGIATTVEGVGWDTAYDRAQREALFWGWGAHTPMELYNIYHTMPETGLATYSPYANPEADAVMDAALSSGDWEASYALWQEAQKSVAADAAWIWLVNIDHLYWGREELQVAPQKLHPHGHGWSIVNNVDQWRWA